MLKSEIRELVRPLRRFITPEYRQKASQAAADYFIESPFFRDNQRFACYMAVAEELDALPLIQALWQANKACYLPLVSTPEEKKLCFALYEEGMKLELNRYRVLEPAGPSQILSGPGLDVILLPLLAFDNKGNRLGTGGGYYDRTFAFTLERGRTQEKKPRLLGLAYELQRVEKIPRDDYDVPLDGVVTEAGITLF